MVHTLWRQHQQLIESVQEKMSDNFVSNESSPATSWSGATYDDVNTPLSEGSLILDAENVNGPEEVSRLDDTYILVIGGCGFIGSHTVWELAKAGHNVASTFSNTSKKANIEAGHYY
jgi:hypothetical protein